MGKIESIKQMMERNANSDAQISSHNTSIRNLEVQIGQIAQVLNTRPKEALPSDTVVNTKGGNNTGHAMAVTTRSGRGGVASTSNPRKIVNDNVVVQEEDEPKKDENMSDEVRIDIDENMKETQDDVNPSREHVTDIPDPVVTKAKAPLPRPTPPYPQRLAKQNNENQFKKFIDMMKSLSINVPLVEALEQISVYAKFMKDLVTKKRSMNCETIKMTHQVSSIMHSMAPKLEDPGAFTIPCTIGSADFAKALCDLGENINLMPYSVFKTLGIGQPRPTSMRLQIADRTTKRPLGIVDDVLIRIDKFILPADFVILDCEVDYEVPIILGRPFLATGKALVDVEAGELTFRMGDENIVFHVCAMINVKDPLEAVLLNHDEEEKDGLVEYANALQGMGSYTYGTRKLSLDLENRKTPPKRPSIEEPPTLELKPLPSHLRLTTTPIITAPNWSLPFELMCDASDDAVIAVLGQRINKIFHLVYYTSKTMSDVQVNYTVTEKELLAIVFAMEKFHPYLMGTKTEKGSENQVADHLSRLEEEGRPHDGLEINDLFSDEQLLSVSVNGIPWFADVANFLVTGIVPNELLSNQRKKLKRDCLDYYWDEPYLFKICNDGVIRRCVPEEEQLSVLEACHSPPYGGHHGGARTTTKVLSCGFYWPTLYKDASKLVRHCDECQRAGRISKKNEMPLTTILEIDIFDVEAVALPNNEARSVVIFLKKNIFTSSSLYKDKMKYLHDKYIRNREFKEGDLVLLFNSRLRMFPGKLKSKWSDPFEVVHVTSFGALDLKNKNGEIFRVNGHRVKHYLGKIDDSHIRHCFGLTGYEVYVGTGCAVQDFDKKKFG
ncbi:uncharacterized protein [Nicotiana tomentosiformis]|uniref:uncharacterized protein n=1 Tax=Nicotiana tomentosiformis TaxID=4098 RepID=UPI00388CE4B9